MVGLFLVVASSVVLEGSGFVMGDVLSGDLARPRDDHELPVHEVLLLLETDGEVGLDPSEAADRLARRAERAAELATSRPAGAFPAAVPPPACVCAAGGGGHCPARRGRRRLGDPGHDRRERGNRFRAGGQTSLGGPGTSQSAARVAWDVPDLVPGRTRDIPPDAPASASVACRRYHAEIAYGDVNGDQLGELSRELVVARFSCCR